MNILVLNAGSSSLKCQIIATDLERIRENTDVRLMRGEVERIGGRSGRHRAERKKSQTDAHRFIRRYVCRDGFPDSLGGLAGIRRF